VAEKLVPAHCVYVRARQVSGSLVDGLPGRGASRCSEAHCAPLGTERLGFDGTVVAH
jgi:hypothetical protein